MQWFPKTPHPHRSVLVGSRNRFERDTISSITFTTLKLKLIDINYKQFPNNRQDVLNSHPIYDWPVGYVLIHISLITSVYVQVVEQVMMAYVRCCNNNNNNTNNNNNNNHNNNNNGLLKKEQNYITCFNNYSRL